MQPAIPNLLIELALTSATGTLSVGRSGSIRRTRLFFDNGMIAALEPRPLHRTQYILDLLNSRAAYAFQRDVDEMSPHLTRSLTDPFRFVRLMLDHDVRADLVEPFFMELLDVPIRVHIHRDPLVRLGLSSLDLAFARALEQTRDLRSAYVQTTIERERAERLVYLLDALDMIAIARKVRSVEVEYALGMAELGDGAGALQAATAALAKDPQCPDAHYAKGRALELLGQTGAQAYYRRAVVLDPDHIAAQRIRTSWIEKLKESLTGTGTK